MNNSGGMVTGRLGSLVSCSLSRVASLPPSMATSSRNITCKRAKTPTKAAIFLENFGKNQFFPPAAPRLLRSSRGCRRLRGCQCGAQVLWRFDAFPAGAVFVEWTKTRFLIERIGTFDKYRSRASADLS
eukprot:scaffold1637_cov253-Pinguiococcus_pyrenoidosus.AAC.5